MSSFCPEKVVCLLFNSKYTFCLLARYIIGTSKYIIVPFVVLVLLSNSTDTVLYYLEGSAGYLVRLEGSAGYLVRVFANRHTFYYPTLLLC